MKKIYLFGLVLISLILINGQQCETTTQKDIHIGENYNFNEVENEISIANSKDYRVVNQWTGNLNGAEEGAVADSERDPRLENRINLLIVPFPEKIACKGHSILKKWVAGENRYLDIKNIEWN
mgnify:FL=1